MRSLLSLTFVIFQLFTVFAAPVVKRTYVPPNQINYALYFVKPENWGDRIYSYVYTDEETLMNSPEIKEWPGRELEPIRNSNAYLIYYPQYLLGHSKIVFTDGTNQAPRTWQEGFEVVKEAVYTVKGIAGIMNGYNENHDIIYSNMAEIYYKPSIEGNGHKFYDEINVYLHYKLGDGEWKDIKMERNPYTNYFISRIDMEDTEEITFAFNDGNNHWDNNNGQNYKFKKFENIYINSEVIFY